MEGNKMKLNEDGKKQYKKWEAFYYAENDILGGDSASGNIIEGWSIIEYRPETLEQFCGMLIFGHDEDAPVVVADWIREYGKDWQAFKNYTCQDVNNALIKYFEEIDFVDDTEKMRDFRELSKDEFLQSYSYFTEDEYTATLEASRGKLGGIPRAVHKREV
jgi:hypothetical protein